MNCAKCGKPATVYVKSKSGAYCTDCFHMLLKESAAQTGRCPSCGRTLDEFRHSALLGCENCYYAFSDWVLPAVRTMQEKDVHVGKRPKTLHGDYSLIFKKEELKEALEKAIKEKRYRDAGLLRKELEAIRAANPGETE